jgi:hypothetical protein
VLGISRARTDVDDSAAAAAADSPETVSIVYVEADGTEKTVEAEVGMNLMDVAHAHNVELEGTCLCVQCAKDRRWRRREAFEVVLLCLRMLDGTPAEPHHLTWLSPSLIFGLDSVQGRAAGSSRAARAT